MENKKSNIYRHETNQLIITIISSIRLVLTMILFFDATDAIFISPTFIELLTDIECALQNISDTKSYQGMLYILHAYFIHT